MKKILFLGLVGCLLTTAIYLYTQDSAISTETPITKVERYIERHEIVDIKAVFDFFIDLISAPMTPKGCKDGTFKGESIVDYYKYKHVISLTIKDEKIVSIDYDEVKEDGSGKRNDKKYCEEMKKGTGVSPAEAYPQYEQRLLERQDLSKVDAVSGASYSFYRFRTSAIRALLKAQKEKP
jgi:major membrane immunogen (membrane-anchored lipoprotein)